MGSGRGFPARAVDDLADPSSWDITSRRLLERDVLGVVDVLAPIRSAQLGAVYGVRVESGPILDHWPEQNLDARRRARLDAGFDNVEALAVAAGVSHNTVRAYERGARSRRDAAAHRGRDPAPRPRKPGHARGCRRSGPGAARRGARAARGAARRGAGRPDLAAPVGRAARTRVVRGIAGREGRRAPSRRASSQAPAVHARARGRTASARRARSLWTYRGQFGKTSCARTRTMSCALGVVASSGSAARRSRGRSTASAAAARREVDEQQADVRVHAHVAHRQVHAVAVVVGERDRVLVDDPPRSPGRRPCTSTAVGPGRRPWRGRTCPRAR